MTDRDMFAMAAIPEVLRGALEEDKRRQLLGKAPLSPEQTADVVALCAYQIADAMLRRGKLASQSNEP